jgi:hypothetical protein
MCPIPQGQSHSSGSAAKLNELVDSTSQKVALEAAKYSLGVAALSQRMIL